MLEERLEELWKLQLFRAILCMRMRNYSVLRLILTFLPRCCLLFNSSIISSGLLQAVCMLSKELYMKSNVVGTRKATAVMSMLYVPFINQTIVQTLESWCRRVSGVVDLHSYQTESISPWLFEINWPAGYVYTLYKCDWGYVQLKLHYVIIHIMVQTLHGVSQQPPSHRVNNGTSNDTYFRTI